MFKKRIIIIWGVPGGGNAGGGRDATLPEAAPGDTTQRATRRFERFFGETNAGLVWNDVQGVFFYFPRGPGPRGMGEGFLRLCFARVFFPPQRGSTTPSLGRHFMPASIRECFTPDRGRTKTPRRTTFGWGVLPAEKEYCCFGMRIRFGGVRQLTTKIGVSPGCEFLELTCLSLTIRRRTTIVGIVCLLQRVFGVCGCVQGLGGGLGVNFG